MFSGRPICVLMLAIIAFTSLSWIGFTFVAGHLHQISQSSNATLVFVDDGITWKEDGPVQCEVVPLNSRFDCHPGPKPNADVCKARGCCWNPVSRRRNEPGTVQLDVPYCFYPAGYRSHKVTNISEHDFGVNVWYDRLLESGYPDDVDRFRMDISYKREGLVAVKIYVEPESLTSNAYVKGSQDLADAPLKHSDVQVQVSKTNFGFRIVRKSSGQSLFDCMDVGGFVFSKQLLQISTLLPSHYIYGLGEHTSPFLKSTRWTSFIMWNRDGPPEHSRHNLYGSHPFYMSLDEQGRAHGVSFLNSHAMEVVLQPSPAATFRVLGGNFNIHVAVGSGPSRVVEQYASLIGKPFLIPYWTLGYHQCKYGYHNLSETRRVLDRTTAAGIPIDTQWNDIDYMDSFKDFTYDKTNYAGLPDFVRELHDKNMHYVQIVDPGISGAEQKGTYLPYDLGLEMDVFIKNSTDLPFVGKVWNPVSTVWPDFTHPRALEYWHKNLQSYHQEVPIDGVWIDMNEPSNSYDGQKDGCATSGLDSRLDNPPYVPNGIEGGTLYSKTICPSARHHEGRHYEYHNTYGLAETMATATAMREIRGKRAFVLSRSTFPGQGHYGAHWTGDVSSTWEDMRFSVSTMLNFNLFGIPMVGADVCGFNGNCTPELCNRWMQLGAFYPFSRNHNSIGQVDQDPVAMGPEVTNSARNALHIRYKILPFFYTQMAKAHVYGTPPVRPVLMNFPKDKTTYGLDRQFMWGRELLVLPVLEPNATTVVGYFPRATWYDYHDRIPPIQGPGFVTVDAPLDTIPLFVKGGSVLPTQTNASTTHESRKNPFSLRVYLTATCEKVNDSSCLQTAKGDLVFDDGESLQTLRDFDDVTFVVFESYHDPLKRSGFLRSTVAARRYSLPTLTFVSIHGIGSDVRSVTINGRRVKFFRSNKTKMIGVLQLDCDLLKPFHLSWTA